MQEEIKSKEEIFNDRIRGIIPDTDLIKDECIAAMEEYRSQFHSQPGATVFVKERIEKRIEELKAELREFKSREKNTGYEFLNTSTKERVDELKSFLKFIEEQPAPTEIVLPEKTAYSKEEVFRLIQNIYSEFAEAPINMHTTAYLKHIIHLEVEEHPAKPIKIFK